MSSMEISKRIIQYLQSEKELSIEEIASLMDVSPYYIENVVNNKSSLSSEHIGTYLNKTNTHFWEFAINAIGIEKLPEKIKKKVLICKQISEHIEKKKKKE